MIPKGENNKFCNSNGNHVSLEKKTIYKPKYLKNFTPHTPSFFKIKEKIINKKPCCSSTGFFKLVGGNNKECINLKKDVSNSVVEGSPSSFGMNMERPIYDIRQIIEQNPTRIIPSNYDTFPELLNAVLNFCRDELYRSDETLEHIDRYCRLMARENQPFPIDFFKLNYTQYKLHMDWYKNNYFNRETGENFYGLKHRKDVVDTFNLCFGYPEGWFLYKLPPRPNKKVKIIPNPETVHKMIHYPNYHPDRDINSLIQYIFAFGFWFGLRNPSELVVMTTDMIFFEEGYMIVKEPKKYNTTRQIFPDKNIFTGKTRKSLKNYVDHLLPKFQRRDSDYLFVTPSNGKPFTRRYLGKLQSYYGKKIYPLFHPYMTREWCATAKLIQARLNGSGDPIGDVKDFLGHEEQKTTEGYVRFARNMFRLYPYDWFKRTLKWPGSWSGESALKSKQGPKTLVSSGNPPREEYGPAEI